MKQVKQSVSVAIFDPNDPARVLIAQRPPDDEDLPNAWGLPAASLKPGEAWEAAIARIGAEKLGVSLRAVRELNRGALQRRDYELEMRLYEAAVDNGEVQVPQNESGVTQYTNWKWGTADDLQPAAAAGSLCCRLFLAG
jgi:ADP-ribose pyrophosphatase YjhB (NUDIX family)